MPLDDLPIVLAIACGDLVDSPLDPVAVVEPSWNGREYATTLDDLKRTTAEKDS